MRGTLLNCLVQSGYTSEVKMVERIKIKIGNEKRFSTILSKEQLFLV